LEIAPQRRASRVDRVLRRVGSFAPSLVSSEYRAGGAFLERSANSAEQHPPAETVSGMPQPALPSPDPAVPRQGLVASAELLPADESVQQLGEMQKEQTDMVQSDKKTAGQSVMCTELPSETSYTHGIRLRCYTAPRGECGAADCAARRYVSRREG
jgi:hypothetical protein